EDTQVFDVGTLPFMPPEYFESRLPSVQTDIYALGIMAYQLLTGRYPFAAESFDALVREKVSRNFIPIEQRRADLPGDLRFVVQRAMHGNTETRFGSWREFCDEIAATLPDSANPREAEYESARYAALRGIPWFSNFSETQIWELTHLCTWLEKPAGEIIF